MACCRFPLVVSSYAEAFADGYFMVDKTLSVRDAIDSWANVILFTRPRRFGKTLNMDMPRLFFEIPFRTKRGRIPLHSVR